ncbi:hypothetical protein J2129_001846 [Methanofollis sp. W23]|nr:hypothetical protein [Methanofollis sp. W23]
MNLPEGGEGRGGIAFFGGFPQTHRMTMEPGKHNQ